MVEKSVEQHPDEDGRTIVAHESFSMKAAKICNSAPISIKKAKSREAMKKLILDFYKNTANLRTLTKHTSC